MTITYLKKAEKTPQTGSDETRNIVAEMLAKIEAGGEEVALAYGRDLDGYAGDAIVSDEVIAAAPIGAIGIQSSGLSPHELCAFTHNVPPAPPSQSTITVLTWKLPPPNIEPLPSMIVQI